MLFHCTHGGDDPERAIVPFIAANVAAASGQEAVVLLTIEGAGSASAATPRPSRPTASPTWPSW